VHSKALLITNVTGNAGSDPSSIPPVGTVLDFVYLPGGFGYASAVVPDSGGSTVNWFTFITPLGDIPTLPTPQPILNPTQVDYFNPFLL
jgi:hypothetical protein